MVVKTTEFRRPATVHRNGKVGLGKYHLNNGSRTTTADWEVRAISQKANGLQSRLNGKIDKKSTVVPIALEKNEVTTFTTTTTMTIKPSNAKNAELLSTLPLSNEMLSTLPSCKISNLRLTSEASPSDSPPPNIDPPMINLCDSDHESSQFKVRCWQYFYFRRFLLSLYYNLCIFTFFLM